MTNPTEQLLSAFEGQDVDGIRSALKAGADAASPVRGKPPVVWLLEEYMRSDRLGDCLRLLIEHGAKLPDPLLAPVLLNDGPAVSAAIKAQPALLQHRASMQSAFTPLDGVTLLHVAAEYCNLEAARALVEAGADVNATSAIDANGLNGQTPLFHTVNSIFNRFEPIMKLLLSAGARTDTRLVGIVWGKGHDWETTFFDVTPISYAQLGLMPQMHRKESEIWANVQQLLEAAGRPFPTLRNVPNRYLARM